MKGLRFIFLNSKSVKPTFNLSDNLKLSEALRKLNNLGDTNVSKLFPSLTSKAFESTENSPKVKVDQNSWCLMGGKAVKRDTDLENSPKNISNQNRNRREG